MAVFVSTMIRKGDHRGRMIRRTVIRYLTLAYILTMRDICPPVRKRFTTFEDIGKAGISRCISNATTLWSPKAIIVPHQII